MTFEEEKIEELKQAFYRIDELLKWWECGQEAFFEAKTSIWHDIKQLPEGVSIPVNTSRYMLVKWVQRWQHRHSENLKMLLLGGPRAAKVQKGNFR